MVAQPAASQSNLFVAAQSSTALWSRAASAPRQLSLFDLAFENVTLATAVAETLAAASSSTRRQIVFVNAHVVNEMAVDPAYRAVVEAADYRLSDGSGMAVAAKMARAGFIANTNGTDFFPLLAREAAASGQTIFLLGGAPRVAELAAETIAAAGYGAAIAGTHHGFFKPGSIEEDAVVDAINAAKPDVVLVGMGVPLQDQWIARHHHRIGAPVMAGVGGLFDFFAGRVARAPLGWRALGLEWCWRLMLEPRRLWRRYLIGNATFLRRAAISAARARLAARAQQPAIEVKAGR